MNITLPDISQFQLSGRQSTAWADSYGALYVAAAYCDIELPDAPFDHIWQHGSMGPWTKRAELLIYNSPNANHKKIFVAREQEEQLLKTSGYPSARAIGLPIVYLPRPPVERSPNSLLVMPQHSLTGIETGSVDQRARYVASMKPFVESFAAVAACVTVGCLTNGYYTKEFKEAGIPVIPGALAADVNAYLRMRCLMEQFDHMTTNCWGSHVAYALYFGMKVSIFGETFAITDEEMVKDETFASFPRETLLKLLHEEANGQREFLQPFCAEPGQGLANQNLGRWLVGDNNKQEPQALKQLFGWD